MLIGAGAAANAILKEIETSSYLNLNPKCIIDDNPGCHGKFLRGVPIVGGRDKIADAVGQYNVDEIIFAIPSANTHVKKRSWISVKRPDVRCEPCPVCIS